MDEDGGDRRSFLASTALAAVAGAAGASVLSGATPAGAATSDVRVRGTYRVGSGLITGARQNLYEPPEQIGALGVRIDSAPVGGAPGAPFSRTRPIEVHTLTFVSTKAFVGPETEIWLAPEGLRPSSGDGEWMEWPWSGPGGRPGALALRVLRPTWETHLIQLTGGPAGVSSLTIATANVRRRTDAACTDGTLRAWVKSGTRELAGFEENDVLALAWVIEEL